MSLHLVPVYDNFLVWHTSQVPRQGPVNVYCFTMPFYEAGTLHDEIRQVCPEVLLGAPRQFDGVFPLIHVAKMLKDIAAALMFMHSLCGVLPFSRMSCMYVIFMWVIRCALKLHLTNYTTNIAKVD